MKELFTTSFERGVLRVCLNRPDIHNAFDDALISSLTEFITKYTSEDKVRVLVLEGSGKSFSAGADLNWMKKMATYSEEENIKDSNALAALFRAINEFPAPVIGKIQGAALGGGSGLVAVCDYAVASEDCRFGFTETRLGLIPAVISPYVLAKIGESNARSLFLSGQIFNAQKAYDIGLVHELAPLEDLNKSLDRVIASHLKAGPQACREAKGLIKKVLAKNKTEDQIVRTTCELIAKRRASSEGQEGMSALLEKRKASWINEN